MNTEKALKIRNALIEDMKNSITYVPNFESDIEAMMINYLHENTKLRHKILDEIRKCISGENYENPYFFGYTMDDIQKVEDLINKFIEQTNKCEEFRQIKKIQTAFIERTEKINDKTDGMLDNWRRKMLCRIAEAAMERQE